MTNTPGEAEAHSWALSMKDEEPTRDERAREELSGEELRDYFRKKDEPWSH